jgi:hypothetical protein
VSKVVYAGTRTCLICGKRICMRWDADAKTWISHSHICANPYFEPKPERVATKES